MSYVLGHSGWLLHLTNSRVRFCSTESFINISVLLLTFFSSVFIHLSISSLLLKLYVCSRYIVFLRLRVKVKKLYGIRHVCFSYFLFCTWAVTNIFILPVLINSSVYLIVSLIYFNLIFSIFLLCIFIMKCGFFFFTAYTRYNENT